jgi:hypothetical protein
MVQALKKHRCSIFKTIEAPLFMVSPENASQSICEGGIGLSCGRGLSLIMAESRHQLCLYQVRAVKNDKNDKLDIFKYQGMEVRVVKDEQGEPLWVAKDIAEVLGYVWNGAPRVAHVPEEWRGG